MNNVTNPSRNTGGSKDRLRLIKKSLIPEVVLGILMLAVLATAGCYGWSYGRPFTYIGYALGAIILGPIAFLVALFGTFLAISLLAVPGTLLSDRVGWHLKGPHLLKRRLTQLISVLTMSTMLGLIAARIDWSGYTEMGNWLVRLFWLVVIGFVVVILVMGVVLLVVMTQEHPDSKLTRLFRKRKDRGDDERPMTKDQ